LATAVPKWFLLPLRPGKIPKVSVFEADSFQRWHDNTNFAGKVIAKKIRGLQKHAIAEH